MADAEVFPPGEHIWDELTARGWTLSDLAARIDRDRQLVVRLVYGTKEVTPEIAGLLGDAFGTSAEMWLGLQESYDRWKEQHDHRQ